MSNVIEYQGRRFRLATKADIGKQCYFADSGIEFALLGGRSQELTALVGHRFKSFCVWNFAYVEITDEPQTVLAKDCEAGKWYESSRWGRVLCCGCTNPMDLFMSFATRIESGQTVMKYLLDDDILTTCPQCWESPKHYEPSPVKAGRHEQGYSHE
jgi:hypothetical protein